MPIPLSHELCLKYKNRLTEFYYSNIKACSYMDNFSYNAAESKIEGMIEHVMNDSAFVFGVFDKELLVGFVWAYKHPFREEERMYINEIRVDELYRGRNVGKQLLSTVEDLARKQGLGAVYLHTEGDNDGAIRLYEKAGYELERVQFRKAL